MKVINTAPGTRIFNLHPEEQHPDHPGAPAPGTMGTMARTSGSAIPLDPGQSWDGNLSEKDINAIKGRGKDFIVLNDDGSPLYDAHREEADRLEKERAERANRGEEDEEGTTHKTGVPEPTGDVLAGLKAEAANQESGRRRARQSAGFGPGPR